MKILTTPDPLLRVKAKPVGQTTKSLLVKIEEMIALLKSTRDPKGVGLAATQVGFNRRVFILIPKRTPKIFVNPEIVATSDKTLAQEYPDEEDRWLEGCLSIPRIWGFVDRPYEVKLRYRSLDKNNNLLKPKTETFRGMSAAFVLHELDHLNGILFTDHILRQSGQLFREEQGKFHPIKL